MATEVEVDVREIRPITIQYANECKKECQSQLSMQIFITASTLKNTGTLLTVPIYCLFDLSLEVSVFLFRIFVIFCKHFVAVHKHFFLLYCRCD